MGACPDGPDAPTAGWLRRRRCGRARAWPCKHGVTVLNAPGTIDADYRGEVQRAARESRPRAVRRSRAACGSPSSSSPRCVGRGLVEARRSAETGRGGRRLRLDGRRDAAAGGATMILLSRRSLLAIAAVVDIALHARPSPVAAKCWPPGTTCRPAISRRCCRPWSGPGILKGVRGPRGGYELARERRRITAGDIVRAAMASTGEDAAAAAAGIAPRRRRRRADGRRGRRGVPERPRRSHRRRPLPAGRGSASAVTPSAGRFHNLNRRL